MNRILAIVFVALSMVMLSSVGYFVYETHQIERRIDAMAKQLLERTAK